jgi:DNA-binding CsgD family transcriptional regulator
MSPAYVLAMSPAPTATTVDAWLQWFATEKQAACRAHLCTRYGLDTLDAEALINAAQLQVFRHWATLDNPLAYFWQTLRHAVAKQGRRRAYERQQLMAYAQQRQVHSHGAARTAEHVAAVLARVSPRQRQLLAWYAQGYSDAEVAGWLTTTPQAVRVARHGAYRALRMQLCPSTRLSRRSQTPAPKRAKNLLGPTNNVAPSRPL